jgi:hypothetical protein
MPRLRGSGTTLSAIGRGSSLPRRNRVQIPSSFRSGIDRSKSLTCESASSRTYTRTSKPFRLYRTTIELWVLGDLVNYGPDPAATIEFVRSHASTVVRGNHDNAVGFGADCGCSPRFRAMADATREYTRSVLSANDKEYLRELPTCACRQIGGEMFFLCHATPSDSSMSTVGQNRRYGSGPKRPVPAPT